MRASTAPFEALYRARRGSPLSAPIEHRFTIAGCREARRYGSAAAVVGIHLFGPYRSGASPLLPLGVAAGYVIYTAVARYFSARPAPLTHRDVVMITAVVDPLFYSTWLFATGQSSVLFVALYLIEGGVVHDGSCFATGSAAR